MDIQCLKNILEKITVALHITKVNSPSIKITEKAGRDITHITTNQIALYSVEEVSKQLLKSVFGELPDVTKQQITNNQTSYFNYLTKELNKISKDQQALKQIIDSPDFQYTSKMAAITASKTDSAELHSNLANLLVERINHDDKELKRIVYNEAITTLGKLTLNQLKIITLCFLLRYTSYRKIVSWESFNSYLNTHIKPFLGFKSTNAEFQHIEYSGCGSISVGSCDLISIYRSQYSFLFLKPIEKSNIDDLNIPDDLKKELIVLEQKENKYFIKGKNKTELGQYLSEKSPDKELNKKLSSLYEASIRGNTEVRDKIKNETDVGKDVIDSLINTPLKNLSLTSVGIVTGATYFEQISGEKIDIEKWIN